MCQHDITTAAAHNAALTGRVEGFDRREIHEIDMRVGALLAKREVERWQYQRGFWDCIYIVAMVLFVAFLFWPEIKAAAKVR